MIGSSRTYAIGMAHYQMGGGWRSLVAVCGSYLFLVITCVGIYYYTDMTTGTRHGMTSAAVSMLLVVEAIALVIFGSFRVSSAIRADVTSQMIESHRLMPIPSWRAVMGYLIGPSTQTIAFALLNLILVYIFAGLTGTDLSKVTIGQASLFTFALLIWSASAVGTFVARYLVLIGLVALIPGMCIMYSVYVALPALALLASPFMGESIFMFTGGPSNLEWTYPASFAAQAVFFSIFFAGACRRYRGTYATTFSVRLAFLLLLAWSGASACGLAMGNAIRFMPRGSYEEDYHGPQIIASVVAAMLLAAVPIRTFILAQNPRRRSFVLIAAFLAAITMAITMIPIGAPAARATSAERFTELGFAIGAFSMMLYAILFLSRNLRPWIAAFVAGLCLGGICLTPLFLEVIRMITLRGVNQADPQFGEIGNFSSIGVVINLWSTENPVSPIAGIVFQWIIAAGIAMIAFGRHRAQKARPVDAPPPPPPALALAPAITAGPPESAQS